MRFVTFERDVVLIFNFTLQVLTRSFISAVVQITVCTSPGRLTAPDAVGRSRPSREMRKRFELPPSVMTHQAVTTRQSIMTH